MNNKVSSAQEFEQRIQDTMRLHFKFPILQVSIEYRRPDLLKLSFNNSLPSAMANAVIEAYKEAVGGADMAEYTAEAANKQLKPDDGLVKDLSQKGYILLKELCISHRILDVPESDISNDVISWRDIPEEDAMAFLMHVINKAQAAQTTSGGEISVEDITKFPDGKRKSKRSTTGKDGETVRAEA